MNLQRSHLYGSTYHIAELSDSSVIGSMIATLQHSVNSFDAYMDDMLTGRNSRQLSVESEHTVQPSSALLRWLRPSSPSQEIEAVLCVPRVLTAALSWMDQHWSTLDLSSLEYHPDDVVSILEYYRLQDELPDMDSSLLICRNNE